jgi:hypothetical protein
MNNRLRNGLILTVILLIIVFFGVKNYISNNTKLKQIRQEYNDKVKTVKQYEHVIEDPLEIAYLKDKINYIETWKNKDGKFFLSSDNSKTSWMYLQNIIHQFNPTMEITFTSTTNKSGESEYLIFGDTMVSDFNYLINYIERLRALYTIEYLNVNPEFRETDFGLVNKIVFSLTLKPWIDINGQITEVNRLDIQALSNDPFKPAVYNEMKDAMQEKYLNIDDLKFISFSDEIAFFQDNSRHIIRLKSNDKVGYGYFSHVDKNSERAVFKINKTGIYKTLYKNLEKGF